MTIGFKTFFLIAERDWAHAAFGGKMLACVVARSAHARRYCSIEIEVRVDLMRSRPRGCRWLRLLLDEVSSVAEDTGM